MAEPELPTDALGRAIAALEAQRPLLGSAVVDAALAPLLAKQHAAHQDAHRTAPPRRRQVSVLFLDVVGSTALSQTIDPEDVLDIIRSGRIRYLLTASVDDPMREYRTEEMILADGVARSSPDRFTLVAEFPVFIQYDRPGRVCRIAPWEYSGVLPDGPRGGGDRRDRRRSVASRRVGPRG